MKDFSSRNAAIQQMWALMLIFIVLEVCSYLVPSLAPLKDRAIQLFETVFTCLMLIIRIDSGLQTPVVPSLPAAEPVAE